jgi:hypothetical protein
MQEASGLTLGREFTADFFLKKTQYFGASEVPVVVILPLV